MKDPDDILPELAALLHGTLASSTDHRRPYIALSQMRARLHLHNAWKPRGKWNAYLTDEAGTTFRGETANFSPERDPAEIAADIQRRVIAPSRPALIAHYTARAKDAAHVVTLQQRIARLDEALGKPGDIRNHRHYNTFYANEGLRTEHESDILPDQANHYRSTHGARIEVYSFECFLMIARLIREDRAMHAMQRTTAAQE